MIIHVSYMYLSSCVSEDGEMQKMWFPKDVVVFLSSPHTHDTSEMPNGEIAFSK